MSLESTIHILLSYFKFLSLGWIICHVLILQWSCQYLFGIYPLVSILLLAVRNPKLNRFICILSWILIRYCFYIIFSWNSSYWGELDCCSSNIYANLNFLYSISIATCICIFCKWLKCPCTVSLCRANFIPPYDYLLLFMNLSGST